MSLRKVETRGKARLLKPEIGQKKRLSYCVKSWQNNCLNTLETNALLLKKAPTQDILEDFVAANSKNFNEKKPYTGLNLDTLLPRL